MIFEVVREVAYCLVLPPQLTKVQLVFHVSMLRKYVRDPSHMIDFDHLYVEENISYMERPIWILDAKEQTLRQKLICLVKVL